MEIQEDYGHTDNPRDNCSALFPQEYKASLQQVPTDVSNRRTSDPHTTSSYA